MSSQEDNSSNLSQDDKRAIKEREIKLTNEIKQLKDLIHTAEFTLTRTKFKNIQTVSTVSNKKNPNKRHVDDAGMRIKYELFQYSGLYCSEFKSPRYVFEFRTGSKYDKETYSVQILTKDGEKILGKCVLPASLDIDVLISTMPLSIHKNIALFLKKCRHQVICYSMRLDQFHSLKESIEKWENCYVHGESGYMRIALEFFKVYHKKTDTYINFTVFFFYETGEVRPNTITIDSNSNNLSSENLSEELQPILQWFKTTDLQTAFNKMMSVTTTSFKWSRKGNLEYSFHYDSSESSDEEGFLHNCDLPKKRTSKNKKTQPVLNKEKKRKLSFRMDHQEEDEIHQDELQEASVENLPAKKSKKRLKKPKNIISTKLAHKNLKFSNITKKTVSPIPQVSKTNLKGILKPHALQEVQLNSEPTQIVDESPSLQNENSVQPKSQNLSYSSIDSLSNPFTRKLVTSTPLTQQISIPPKKQKRKRPSLNYIVNNK